METISTTSTASVISDNAQFFCAQVEKPSKMFIRKKITHNSFTIEANIIRTNLLNKIAEEGFAESLTVLHKISLLEANWNTYGAKPFSTDIIAKTTGLIFQLSKPPMIFPTGRNSIQLEFYNNDKYLEIEIFETSYKYFTDGMDDGIAIGEEELIKKVNDFYAA
jgi:hypothetical protein